MTRETKIDVTGTLVISNEGCVTPDSGQAKGIFIYDFIGGDIGDANLEDLGNPSFITALIPYNADTEVMKEMANELEGAKYPNPPLLGLALPYTGLQAMKPLSSRDMKISQLEHYADLFNKTDEWTFLPTIFLSREACEDQTINGLEISLNQQLQYLENETNYRPIIQVSWEVANQYLTDPIFKKYPLWLTEVREGNPLQLPGSWRDGDWTFLETQVYLEEGMIKGKHNGFEEAIFSQNNFNGDKFGLQKFSSGITTTSISGNRRLKL